MSHAEDLVEPEKSLVPVSLQSVTSDLSIGTGDTFNVSPLERCPGHIPDGSPFGVGSTEAFAGGLRNAH